MTAARLRLVLLLAIAGLGCEGTEVGNPTVEPVALSLTAHSSSSAVGFGAAPMLADEDGGEALPSADAGTAVTVDKLWVSLGDVRFVLDDRCDRDPDTRTIVPGPIVAELAGDPAALTAKLPDADYCSVRVSLERATDADAKTPTALVGYSVLLEGWRADGARFRLRSRAKPDFVLRTRGEPFHLAQDATPLFLAFDAAAWLKDVDLDAVAPDDDGNVLIETTGEDALRQFESNLRSSLALFKDADEDGALDRGEASTPLAD